MEDYTFSGTEITNSNIFFLKNEWRRLCPNVAPPIINYCFHGYGRDLLEKMIVLDDSKSVILLVKLGLTNKNDKRASCYNIVKSKLYLVEIQTGRIILKFSDPDQENNQKYQQYVLQKNIPNVNDTLAYYIPNMNIKNLHVMDWQNKSESERSETTVIEKINETSFDQCKRRIFGKYVIHSFFTNLF